jgi:hypothetical protein
MKWRETVTMRFFPRTIAGLRPDQQRSDRSMTTVPARPAPGHSEPDEILRSAGWPDGYGPG